MSASHSYRGGGDPGAGPAPHPDDTRLQQMRANVHEVSDVMRQNMNRIIDRDGNISDLVTRSETLQEASVNYSRTTARVQRKMWWQNTKMRIIIGVVVAVIVVLIILGILAAAGVFK